MLGHSILVNGEWEDVIAIVRDLQGFSIVVWQDRAGLTGTVPIMMAEMLIHGEKVDVKGAQKILSHIKPAPIKNKKWWQT